MGKLVPILFLVIVITLGACGGESEATEDAAPTQASTPVPPTLIVKHSIRGCDYIGPSELAAGEHLISVPELNTYKAVRLGRIIGDHTFRELLDLQNEEYEVEEPSWTERLNRTSREEDLAANEAFHTFQLEEQGQYYAILFTEVPRTGARKYLCSPAFQVVAAPGE